jgi:heme-degrading monooxygenase HmoA
MFIVLYRWSIKPELEDQFIRAWSEVTDYYRKNHGSLGSRLHKGSDGIFYSYAQWRSAEQRQKAFEIVPELAARAKMREAIAESYPEIILENVSDYLLSTEL